MSHEREREREGGRERAGYSSLLLNYGEKVIEKGDRVGKYVNIDII